MVQSKTVMPQYARAYFSSGAVDRSKFLIDAGELQDLIAEGSPSLRLVNASWYLPMQKTDAKAQHVENRLTKETQYFSISEIAEPGSDLPNTMPNAEVFIENMRALRIRKDDTIVMYDHLGMFSVARAAFMMRYFGASNVRILNGGLQNWLKEGRAVHSGPYTPGEGLSAEGDYSYAVKDPSTLITGVTKMHEIAGALNRRSSNGLMDQIDQWQITDNRPLARFNGEMPEPRNTRAGNISGSINVPFGQFVDDNGCIKSNDEIRAIFEGKGINLTGDKQTVHSCGSGTTACIVDLAFQLVGGSKSAIYDGSWSEYGRHEEPDFSKKA